MRSPENASGSAAQAAVTVLVESVKFSNHAAPASTSAAGSSQRRQALLRRLELPEHLTANGMLEALNLLTDREELAELLQDQ